MHQHLSWTDCRGTGRKKAYAVIRLSFDDRNDLSFSDDVVELDKDSLDSSCRRRRDRDFHLHRFDKSNLVAVADIAVGCNGIPHTRPATSVTILMSGISILPGDRLTDWRPRERLFVVAADCLR